MAKPIDVTDVCRVSIHAREHKVDLSVSTRVPLSRLTRDVARAVVDELASLDADTDWIMEPNSKLVLSPAVGSGWKDTSKTLAELQVCDGDTLVLSTERASERFPALVESMADATAAVNNARFREWDRELTEKVMVVLIPLVIAAISAAATVIGVTREPLHWHMVGCLAVLAAATIGGSFSAKDTSARPSALSAASYVPAAATAALLVPGWGVWNTVAVFAVLATLPIVYLALDVPTRWVHIAAAVPGISAAVGGGLVATYSLWRSVSVEATAAVIALVAMLALYNMPGLSRSLARISMPDLTAVAAEASDEQRKGLLEQARVLTQRGELEPVFHQNSRNVEARFIRVGLVAGSAVTVVAAAIVSATTVHDTTVRYLMFSVDERIVSMVTYLTFAVIFLLRGTWFRDRGIKLATLISGLSVWGAYVLATAIGNPDTSMIRMVAVTFGSALVLFLVTARVWVAKPMRNPKVLRRLQLLESALYILPIINVVALVNTFFHVRHL